MIFFFKAVLQNKQHFCDYVKKKKKKVTRYIDSFSIQYLHFYLLLQPYFYMSL